MSVYINDGPMSFYKVLVDIKQVTVLVDTANSQNAPDDPNQWGFGFWGHGRDRNDPSLIWDTLNINPGVYDLLQLRNGADTLLGTGTYTQGKVIRVRITLGSDNTIFTDSSDSYPLVIFGPNNYFDINVSRENVNTISNNDFELCLDFNLYRSVFYWSGTFYLSPYVVAYNRVTLSAIEGSVFPPAAAPLIEAINGSDTIYAIPNWNGNYKFVGLTAATYTLNFQGHNGYSDTTLSNITVDSSAVTNVPTVTLHQ
jgi:hypothetical protein